MERAPVPDGLAQPTSDLRALHLTDVGRVVKAAYGQSLIPLLDDEAGRDDDDADASSPRRREERRLGFRVMLRKRPLLQWELDADEFDVVTCERVKRRGGHRLIHVIGSFVRSLVRSLDF